LEAVGADKMQLIRTARDYALKLPRANGKSGVTGFCNGGGMAWEEHSGDRRLQCRCQFLWSAADAATMAKIQAPVLAFAGDDDPGLAPESIWRRTRHAATWARRSNSRSIRT
jgi:dienelactone hydrolase